MSSRIIVRGLLIAALALTAGTSLLATRVNAGFPFCGKCLDQTGCSVCGQVCDHCCKLDAKIGDEETPCFDVESKIICIPRVVFPWQKRKCRSCDSCDGRGCTDCVHNGARVRRICVLQVDKIKCPTCKYTWTAEKICSGCDSGCDATLPPSWQDPAEYEPSQNASSDFLGPGEAIANPVPVPTLMGSPN